MLFMTGNCYVRIVDFATWTQTLGPKMARVTVSTRTPLLNTAGTSRESVLWNLWKRFWFRFRFRMQTKFSTVFQQQTMCTKSCHFNVRSSPLFYDFCIQFYVRSGSISGSAKAKSCGFCGSGSTTLARGQLESLKCFIYLQVSDHFMPWSTQAFSRTSRNFFGLLSP
jgi:hypothetical protein